MTNHQILGAVRPLKPLRAGLCVAIALLSLQAPLAHADAFATSKASTAAANKELADRLAFMEQRMTEMAQREATAQAPGAPGSLNLPTPPGMPPVPVSDDELKLNYERKGELNGSVIIKRDGRIQVMQRMEFERFDAEAKAKARLQLTKDAMTAMMPPLAAPTPAANAPAFAPGKPPVSTLTTNPPAPAPAAVNAAAPTPTPSPSAAAVRAAKANPASVEPPKPTK